MSSAKRGGAGGEREKRESREKGKGRLLQESVFLYSAHHFLN